MNLSCQTVLFWLSYTALSMKHLWLTTLSFLPLYGAGVACQSICRWPRSGQGLDTEALRLPQGYLAHNHDTLPPQCAWLFADASWHMSPQKEADEGKAISRQRGGQREKALGSSPSQGPACFNLEEAWLAWQSATAMDDAWIQPSVFECVFQGIIWHFCVGTHRHRWDKDIQKRAALDLSSTHLPLFLLKDEKQVQTK